MPAVAVVLLEHELEHVAAGRERGVCGDDVALLAVQVVYVAEPTVDDVE